MSTLASIAARPAFAKVPFLGADILAARIGDEVRVPMKGFCGSMGIAWEPQRKRIGRDRVLAEGASMMEVPSTGGLQTQLALPLGLLPGFLFGLDERRFAPELQEKVHAFRAKCFEVLWQYFHGEAAQRRREPVPALPAPMGWQERDALGRSIRELIAMLSAETRPPARAALHQLLQADCAKLGISCPARMDLGKSDYELIAQLVAGLDTLTERGVAWNRAVGARLAIVLPDIARLFARHDVDVTIDDRLRSALDRSTDRWRITRQRVGQGRKAALCHVLERL